MQTAFVQISPQDAVGDRVTLLGDTLDSHAIAATWQTSPQEVLVRLCGSGSRRYRS